MIVKTERFEYAIRWPDGLIESEWASEAAARHVAARHPGAVVVVRTVSITEWLEVPE
jgi:hypothetical protein